MTLALWLLVSASAQACPVTHIRVGIFNFPPLYSVTPQGQPQGLLVQLLDRVTREAGCIWSPYYFSDAPSAGKSLLMGGVELMMAIHHPKLESKVLYGTVPLTRLQLNLYHRSQVAPARSVADLKGGQLVVIRGYGYGGLISQLLDPAAEIDLLVAEDHDSAFELLLQGKAEYLLGYQGPSTLVLDGFPPQQLAWVPWRSEDLFFIVSKHVSDPQALLEALEQALQRVR